MGMHKLLWNYLRVAYLFSLPDIDNAFILDFKANSHNTKSARPLASHLVIIHAISQIILPLNILSLNHNATILTLHNITITTPSASLVYAFFPFASNSSIFAFALR